MSDTPKSISNLHGLMEQRIDLLWNHFVNRTPESLDAIKFHDQKIKEFQNG